tara:strand:- start:300 stop:1016 length:717 start_codon:yes stop_codon:yes gene_type:complete
MSNYGDRMIDVGEEQKEIKEEVKEEKEENVFDNKKQKLKDHLAKCREKSAVVRKAKAEEKKANKKSVGRPKKQEVKKIDKDDVANDHKVVEEIVEEEVFKDHRRENDEQSTKTEGKTTPQFDIEDLFNKFDDRMNKKLEQFKTPPAPIQEQLPLQLTPQQNNSNENFMTLFKQQEAMIRKDERNKIEEAKQDRKLLELEKAKAKYYGRLPPPNFIQTQAEPQNEWDKLLNVRKHDNYW